MLREISNTTLIEELIGLFDNPKVKKLLLESYLLSQKENKVLSDAVFAKLFYLKKANPNINIIIDYNVERAGYDAIEDIIYLSDDNIPTFFHELTHLLSYEYSKSEVPFEWIDFKKKFLSSPQNISLIYDFITLCDLKRKKIIGNINQVIENLELELIKPFQPFSKNETIIKFDTIGSLGDIIDAIFDGKSYDNGIVYEIDENHIAQKAPKTAGHGCEYFNSTNNNFEEVIANYLAIKLTDPNNELFVMLKNILGNEFVLFLEQRCNEISGIYYTINNNLTMK